MMYALDRGVGKIVDELKAAGKFDNTIIFFLSDNGGSTTNQSSNLPLKGFKGNKFERRTTGSVLCRFGAIVSKRDQRFHRADFFAGHFAQCGCVGHSGRRIAQADRRCLPVAVSFRGKKR